MKLTATSFDAETGELLPVYRDAYLRGDLARAAAQAVDDYLCREAVASPAAAPNRLSQSPPAAPEHSPRFHHRALSLSLIGLTLAGASTAASHLPTSKAPVMQLPKTSAAAVAAAPLAAARPVLLQGRILNEQGQPLAGATVRQKGTAHSTRTDASGRYCLRVPAATPATLQCSLDGYAQQETSAAPPKLLQ